METERDSRQVERVFGAEIGFSIHAELNGNSITSTSLNDDTDLPASAEIVNVWSNWRNDVLSDQGITDSNAYGFMSNGARFYFDQNRTPEYCTPEAASPEQLVKYELSSEKFIMGMLRRLREAGVIDKYYANKRTTDQLGNSWGYHENIFARARIDKSDENTIALMGSFNATRAVYAGTGGIMSENGEFGYVVSPRLFVTKELVSSSRTGVKKPLICNDNSNAEFGMYRVHQVCGDASLSPWTIRMQHATNSLLMKAIESRKDFSDLFLEDPLIAASLVAGDLSLRSTLRLDSGKSIGATEWQSAFAEEFTEYFEPEGLSEDEIWALEQIEEVTDDLELSTDLATDRVEWVARLDCIRELSLRDPETQPINEKMRDIDYTWDSLDSRGIAIKRRDNGWGWHGFDSQYEDWEINYALQNPPTNTRACFRADIIRSGEGKEVQDWGVLSNDRRIHPLAFSGGTKSKLKDNQ